MLWRNNSIFSANLPNICISSLICAYLAFGILKICTFCRPKTAWQQLSEPAWKSVFSESFALSSSKGDSLPSSSAPKSPQKHKFFRSKNFECEDFCLNKVKAQWILYGFTSILTKFKQKSSVTKSGSDNYCQAQLRLSAVEQNFLNQCSEAGFDSALIFGKKFDF